MMLDSALELMGGIFAIIWVVRLAWQRLLT